MSLIMLEVGLDYYYKYGKLMNTEDIIYMDMEQLLCPWVQVIMKLKFPAGDQWEHGLIALSGLTHNYKTQALLHLR